MKKSFLTAILFSSTIMLAGCFGNDGQLEEGITLYEQGDEESLVEARNFFVEHLEANPEDSDAEKWIKKVDEQYVLVGKETVDKYFEEGNITRAYEIMKNLSVIAPNDSEIQTAFADIEVLYQEQVDFDKFSTYLEDAFKDSFEIYTAWDKASSQGILGSMSAQQLIDQSKITLSEISEVRKVVEDSSLTLTNTRFVDINNYLFEYLNQVEASLAIVASATPERIQGFEIKDRTQALSPERFNGLFAQIKKELDYYAGETDAEGEKVRKITNTLSFDYNEIVKRQEEEAKKTEKEAAEEKTENTFDGAVDEEVVEEDAK